MDQLIPSLAELIAPFRACFRAEVFQTFQVLIAGWIICVGPRTISEVWQATGLAARRHHDTAYAVFRGMPAPPAAGGVSAGGAAVAGLGPSGEEPAFTALEQAPPAAGVPAAGAGAKAGG